MEFNFPPFRVQQRSIPKFESCTVYPGMVAVLAGQGETLPQFPVSAVPAPSVRQVGVMRLVQHWLVGKSLEAPAFPFCFPSAGKVWWWLFVTYQTAQAILWGDLVKALWRWPLTSMFLAVGISRLAFFFFNPFFNLLIEQPVQQTFFWSQTGYCLWTSLFMCNLFCFVWLERKCQHIRLCSLLRGMKARVRRRDNGLGFPGTSLSHFLPSQAPWES